MSENHNLSTDHAEHFSHLLSKPHQPRNRTMSESERIMTTPSYKGVIESFCRQKGHGFIKPDDGSEHVFLHISDIEGEWCPKEGDVVSFRKILVPPKNQKYQAVHVHFVHLKEGVAHDHWDTTTPPGH